MRRILAMLLSVLMLLSLTACGGKTPSTTTAPSTPAPSEAVTTKADEGWVPTQDIEFVIPFGAGGGNDVLVRKLIQIIEQYKLCPVTITPINKSGGSGVVGYTYLKEKGEGYEYALSSTSSSFFTAPAVGNSPYDPRKDFSFIAHMVTDPTVICASPKSGITSLEELVKYAKENPGMLNCGGIGSASDDVIIYSMLKEAAGIDFKYVTYDDEGLLVSSAMGGHVDTVSSSLAEVKEYIEAGTLIPIVVVSDNRLNGLENVPTFAECGYPEINHQKSRGLIMNPGADEKVLKYYSDLFKKVFDTPEFKQYVKDSAMQDIFMDYAGWTDYSKKVYEEYLEYFAKIQY